MYLAYSALNTLPATETNQQLNSENEQLLRYNAYQSTCDKYSNEIAAIQKYFPGWLPKFT